MTRTTAHLENPHNNDADNDEDELSGIVLSPLVVCGLGFFAILPITHG